MQHILHVTRFLMRKLLRNKHIHKTRKCLSAKFYKFNRYFKKENMPSLIKYSVFLLLTLNLVAGMLKYDYDPDTDLSIVELISSKGYPVEEHFVHTNDGYIITVHRIRGGRNDYLKNVSEKTEKKPVVFLQHGLLDCSATWVVNSANESLGFILADAGYDVWMGNMRGNTYALAHETITTKDAKFWDFSWDEHAKDDLPSMIYYALDHTNQENLVYIGHSQGTMIMFAEGSNKKLASKIKLFIALGPVATLGSIESPLKFFSDFGTNPYYNLIFDIFGIKNFLPSTMIIKWLADIVCTNQVTTPLVCDNIIFLFTGPSENLNNSRLAVYTHHAPAGTSVKNMVHYAQGIKDGVFQLYDYGDLNEKKYNQTTVPALDVTTIDVPIALYWAEKDWLADPIDVKFLQKNLPKIVDDFECPKWNHLDFLWATNANTLLYPRILKLMKSYL